MEGRSGVEQVWLCGTRAYLQVTLGGAQYERAKCGGKGGRAGARGGGREVGRREVGRKAKDGRKDSSNESSCSTHVAREASERFAQTKQAKRARKSTVFSAKAATSARGIRNRKNSPLLLRSARPLGEAERNP
jgi:hypothetical protein